jgi:hypothetical protein
MHWSEISNWVLQVVINHKSNSDVHFFVSWHVEKCVFLKYSIALSSYFLDSQYMCLGSVILSVVDN